MYHTPVARARIARTRRGRHRGDRYMRVVRPLLIPIALFSAARRRTRFRAVGCGRLHASHAGDAGRPAGRRLAHVAPDVRPLGAQPARPDQHDQRRRPAAGVGLDDAGGPSGDDAARARWDDVPRRAMRLCRGARRPRRLSYLGVSAGPGRASRQRCPLGRHSARSRRRAEASDAVRGTQVPRRSAPTEGASGCSTCASSISIRGRSTPD